MLCALVLLTLVKFLQAYESLTEGFGRTASALIGNPIKVYNRGAGAGSALASAICGAPAAAVAPVSASFSAIHYAFLGLRNRSVYAHSQLTLKYLCYCYLYGLGHQ